MYDMVDSHNVQPLCNWYPSGRQCNVLLDQRARELFFDWCAERNIVELYIDSAIYSSPALLAAFQSFVVESDARGIDLQLLVGQDISPASAVAVIGRVSDIVGWCKQHTELCGGWPCTAANNWCKRNGTSTSV